MMNGYFPQSKHLRRLAMLGVVMALSACVNDCSDSAGTTNSSAVLGASEVAPVSGRTTVVGPEAGGAAFAEGDPARNSIPTLTRVKNADVSTLFEAEKSTLMTEGAADYEILIKFPVFPTGDSTITVTVPDALVSKLTSTNAIVAYVINGDIDEPSPFDPVASNYDPSTKKLSFVLPKDYLSESAAGSGFAGEVTVKIGLAKTFEPEPTTTGTSTKSLGTSAYQTTLGFNISTKLPCPVDGSNGCIETSRYGPRIGGSSPMHKGVDFRARNSTELFAVADGVIEIPKNMEKWGVVDIIVSGVTRYRYKHLSRTDVTIGQKVKAGDVIGLSGNTAPPKKDGTPRNLAPHLHFEIWQPMPLVTDGLKRRSITAKVDPFPYFIDKVSVDIPGNKTPGDTTVTDKFSLELKGYDTDGRPVTTEIDNSDPDFISRMRPVLWAASTGSVTQQEKYDTSFHKSLGTYQISKDPKKRNLADIVMPSSEVNATVTAAWEGVMPEAKYTLSSSSFILLPAWRRMDLPFRRINFEKPPLGFEHLGMMRVEVSLPNTGSGKYEALYVTTIGLCLTCGYTIIYGGDRGGDNIRVIPAVGMLFDSNVANIVSIEGSIKLDPTKRRDEFYTPLNGAPASCTPKGLDVPITTGTLELADGKVWLLHSKAGAAGKARTLLMSLPIIEDLSPSGNRFSETYEAYDLNGAPTTYHKVSANYSSPSTYQTLDIEWIPPAPGTMVIPPSWRLSSSGLEPSNWTCYGVGRFKLDGFN